MCTTPPHSYSDALHLYISFHITPLLINSDVLTHLLNILFLFLPVLCRFAFSYTHFRAHSLHFQTSYLSEMQHSARESSEKNLTVSKDIGKADQGNSSNHGHYVHEEFFAQVEEIVNPNNPCATSMEYTAALRQSRSAILITTLRTGR